jgi:two-component system response regulator AtoC
MSGTAAATATTLGNSGAIPPEEILFGASSVMREVRQRAAKISQANLPILLSGDGGTGKESLARWIHANSPFRNGALVKINCAAIPGSLLESEMFGYEKGAFTGAHGAKPGRVEQAHNGTLFLDEISDLSMGLQSKLLHFLQDGTFSRLGGDAELSVNARVICATNCDLERQIEAGNFRADLYYRINVVRLRLPQLRERREDIPALVEYFRNLYMRQFGKEAEPFGPEMIGYLQHREWPGNLRELSNAIARYVLIGPESLIPVEPRSRRGGLSAGESPVSLKRVARNAIREMERNVILETLRANQWNRRKTAAALKISYRALIYKIRDAGLTSQQPSSAASDISAD